MTETVFDTFTLSFGSSTHKVGEGLMGYSGTSNQGAIKMRLLHSHVVHL